MTPQHATAPAVARILEDPRYLRERQAPRPSDASYLHLRDLLTFLREQATDQPIRLLDYGCGGSPYRSLFPQAQYHRADDAHASDIDYVIAPDGTIAAPSATFDAVLSTQVLEHVPEPARYLAECHRLLQPGGRLVLTTHGSYEDHGCPADYHRWTADGLHRSLTTAGFEVVQLQKLTCSGRALLQLLSHHHGSLYGPRWHPFGAGAALVRSLFTCFRPLIHRWSDQFQREHSLRPAGEADAVLYLALGAVARKRS